MNSSAIIATLTVFLSIASMCSAADKKQLEAALAAVNANLKTSAGKQYDELIGKEFPEKYWSEVRKCKQSLPGTSTDPFDMFLRLNADGKVQEVLIYPETRFASCIRDAVLVGKFTNPPHDTYWINIHVQIKQ